MREAIRPMRSEGTISCWKRSIKISKKLMMKINFKKEIKTKNKFTFLMPISTAVRTLKSSLERYLKTSTSSFILFFLLDDLFYFCFNTIISVEQPKPTVKGRNTDKRLKEAKAKNPKFCFLSSVGLRLEDFN